MFRWNFKKVTKKKETIYYYCSHRHGIFLMVFFFFLMDIDTFNATWIFYSVTQRYNVFFEKL